MPHQRLVGQLSRGPSMPAHFGLMSEIGYAPATLRQVAGSGSANPQQILMSPKPLPGSLIVVMSALNVQSNAGTILAGSFGLRDITTAHQNNNGVISSSTNLNIWYGVVPLDGDANAVSWSSGGTGPAIACEFVRERPWRGVLLASTVSAQTTVAGTHNIPVRCRKPAGFLVVVSASLAATITPGGLSTLANTTSFVSGRAVRIDYSTVDYPANVPVPLTVAFTSNRNLSCALVFD